MRVWPVTVVLYDPGVDTLTAILQRCGYTHRKPTTQGWRLQQSREVVTAQARSCSPAATSRRSLGWNRAGKRAIEASPEQTKPLLSLGGTNHE
jgi:hypothetical protein